VTAAARIERKLAVNMLTESPIGSPVLKSSAEATSQKGQ
jgi:hypothetical protein